MRSINLVIVLLSFPRHSVVGSECGDSTIPYSLEVLPSGQPILGCARPTCFGWHPNGHQLPTTAKFFRIDRQPDGFLRDDPVAIHSFDVTDPRVYSQQHATCEFEFQSLSCGGEDQWVGGISPVMNATSTQIIAYQCCTYPPLRASTDRGIATVSGGQIVVGGEVMEQNMQYAFDYISNIEKKIDEEGEVFYDVNIRRFSCLNLQKVDRSVGEILNAENIIRHVNGKKAVAHQAPIAAVNPPIETGNFAVPQGVANGQQLIVEEVVSQEALVDQTNRPPPPQVEQRPPQVFQPFPQQQAFVQQPIVTQGFQQPVPVQAQPSGFAPIGFALPTGLQLYYCLPRDAEVDVLNNGYKRMDELKVGDWVLTLDNDGKGVTYVPVQYWIHRDPNQKAQFIEFSLDNGKKFSLTEKHMIYVTECQIDKLTVESHKINSNPVAAENVKIGDCFYIAHRKKNKMYQHVKVLDINIVTKTGIYSPMTSVGHLLVDRIHTSCHSQIDIHSLQNTFFASVLSLRNSIHNFFGGAADNAKENNIGYGLHGVLAVLDLVLPSHFIA